MIFEIMYSMIDMPEKKVRSVLWEVLVCHVLNFWLYFALLKAKQNKKRFMSYEFMNQTNNNIITHLLMVNVLK